MIVSMIGSLGFPIVACGYLATTLNKTMNSLVESINQAISTTSRQQEENNAMLQRLLDKAHFEGNEEV